jgi:hypothetical protein
MRGMSYRPGKSWPRNPQPSNNQAPDPAVVRQRIRAHGRPITPTGLGL